MEKTLNMHVERWNSKWSSGHSFDSISKIYFAAFLHRNFEVIQIWLTHQSKGLIFYFGMKKVLSPQIFERFVGNRQTKFHILKFRVCVNTHYIWTCEIHFVCFPQIFKIRLKSFSCQNRKSELLSHGLIISGSLQSFDVKKLQNKFWKLSQNCDLSALLNFASLNKLPFELEIL